MPKYDFQCQTCGKVEESVYIPVEEVNKNKKWNERTCQSCNNLSKVVITPAEFIIKGWSPDRARRAVKRFDEDYTMLGKGFESSSEMRESMDIAKEEEKRLGKEPGELSGTATKATTEEGVKKAKKRAAEKVKAARKQRGM